MVMPTIALQSPRSRPVHASWWVVILLANGVVVYRAWGGQPAINEVDVERNPLGPLQDIGPAAVASPL